MGNNASVPISYPIALEGPPPTSRSEVKKSSGPRSRITSQVDAASPTWRRASEPIVPTRRKSLFRKKDRRRSEEETERDIDGVTCHVPTLVIGGRDGQARDSQDSYEGLMIRVAGRKFSRAQPVDTEDALEALERITRIASLPTSSDRIKGTGLGLMASGNSQFDQPVSFDTRYRLDSPQRTSSYDAPSAPISSTRPEQLNLAPHESPATPYPLSPVSHWSDSSACGLTPPQTFQSFRNSINLPKTINRYSSLFSSSAGDSEPSPNGSNLEVPLQSRQPARSKLGTMWKGHGSKKAKAKASRLGEIVVLKTERVGSSRYSDLTAAAQNRAYARTASSSSSSPASHEDDGSTSRSSSHVDRISWIQLDSAPEWFHPAPPAIRRHSSPQPCLGTFVSASPGLPSASRPETLFVPIDPETPSFAVGPSPVKISARLPSGHPAAYHHNRFMREDSRSPASSTHRLRLREIGRASSYASNHRSSSYTNNSRYSIVSEVESTSSALQATVQHGFRTTRVGSVSIPLSELVPAEPVPVLPSTLLPSTLEQYSKSNKFQQTISPAWQGPQCRPPQASGLVTAGSVSPDGRPTAQAQQTAVSLSSSSEPLGSHQSEPSTVPLGFEGYSLKTHGSSRRASRPPSLDLYPFETRSSSPNSLPTLTSATSTTFSARSSLVPQSSPGNRDPSSTFEQADPSAFPLSKPLTPIQSEHFIDFANFSLSTRNDSIPPQDPMRNISPTMPSAMNWVSPSQQKILQPHPDGGWTGDARPLPPILLDRRDTYPRSSPIRSNKENELSVYHDTLPRQAFVQSNDPPERGRKRGLSKEEVSIWLNER